MLTKTLMATCVWGRLLSINAYLVKMEEIEFMKTQKKQSEQLELLPSFNACTKLYLYLFICCAEEYSTTVAPLHERGGTHVHMKVLNGDCQRQVEETIQDCGGEQYSENGGHSADRQNRKVPCQVDFQL